MAQDHLDFVAGEESTGAGEFAVSEMEVRVVAHGELVPVGVFRLRGIFPQFRVAEGVESLGIAAAGQVGLVVQDCVRGHGEMGTGWDVGTVTEGEGLLGNALKRHFVLCISIFPSHALELCWTYGKEEGSTAEIP